MKNGEIESSSSATRNGSGDPAESNGRMEVGQKIEQSIAYMKQHLDQSLQVAVLAAHASISPSHYFALFKRHTGSAPIDYFTRLRMQRACELLSQTGLSVKEVATALGYEDPFYFSRVFKSIKHLSPSDYRAIGGDGRGASLNGCGHNGGSRMARRSSTLTLSENGDGLRLPHRSEKNPMVVDLQLSHLNNGGSR